MLSWVYGGAHNMIMCTNRWGRAALTENIYGVIVSLVAHGAYTSCQHKWFRLERKWPTRIRISTAGRIQFNWMELTLHMWIALQFSTFMFGRQLKSIRFDCLNRFDITWTMCERADHYQFDACASAIKERKRRENKMDWVWQLIRR